MAKVGGTGSSGGRVIGGGGNVSGGKKSSSGDVKKTQGVDITHNAFVDAMNTAELSIEKKDLQKGFEEIDKLGRELTRNPSMKLLEEYKKKISEFLKDAVKRIYKVDSKEGLLRLGGDQKVYLNIEKVDEKLEAMTIKFMKEQKSPINLINDVEGVRGLVYSIIV